MKSLRIGVCGTGNVGKALLIALKNSAKILEAQGNVNLEVALVGARKGKSVLPDQDMRLTEDIMEVADDEGIDVLVELIGGVDISYELIKKALNKKKHVVTANKALIAKHGDELFKLAKEKGVQIGFEASVAGGTPVIKAIREGLVAHKILWFAGILNGTSNYIISYMSNSEVSFEEALESAQSLGLAESDPTLDINGTDAAQKASILASLAFQVPFNFSSVLYEGIENVTLKDIRYAEELGYSIKHIALGKVKDNKVSVCAHPMLVKNSSILSKVGQEMNALEVFAEGIGSTVYYGPGAGPIPTASAVIADLVDIGKGALFNVPESSPNNTLIKQSQDICARYIRIEVLNEPGVIAKISSIFAKNDISIDSLIQHDSSLQTISDKGIVSVVIITGSLNNILSAEVSSSLEEMDEVHGDVKNFRIHSEQ